MKNITSSATKIVLILMAISSCALTFMKIMDAKDFGTLVTLVFMAYYKTNTPSPTASAE